jgi:hypothetical protein
VDSKRSRATVVISRWLRPKGNLTTLVEEDVALRTSLSIATRDDVAMSGDSRTLNVEIGRCRLE